MGLKGPSTTIHPYCMCLCIATNKAHSILAARLAVCSLAARALAWGSKYTLASVYARSPMFSSSVNVPWPEKGMTDADYIHAFHKVIMPIALEFAPELVISKGHFFENSNLTYAPSFSRL